MPVTVPEQATDLTAEHEAAHDECEAGGDGWTRSTSSFMNSSQIPDMTEGPGILFLVLRRSSKKMTICAALPK